MLRASDLLLMAMSSLGDQGQLGGQFLPFALILAIFYFLILMPMQRRQKKVQEFQDSLKVGDKIVTTGGIYGQITKVNDKSVQVQIADKVRIEIAARVGRRLPGPGAGRPGIGQRIIMNKNLRWKLLTSFAVFIIFFAVGVYPILAQRFPKLPAPVVADGQPASPRPRPEGRRPPRPARPDRRRAAACTRRRRASSCARRCAPPASPSASITVTSPTTFRVEGVPADRDAEFRRIADEQAAHELRPQLRRRTAPTTSR